MSMSQPQKKKKAAVALRECIELFTTMETLGEHDPWYASLVPRLEQGTYVLEGPRFAGTTMCLEASYCTWTGYLFLSHSCDIFVCATAICQTEKAAALRSRQGFVLKYWD